jgi:hypothetical protein
MYELTPSELMLAEVALRWLAGKLEDEFERDRAKSAAVKLAQAAELARADQVKPAP